MRYVVIRPRLSRWDDLQESPQLEGRTVYDQEPVETGILDADGHPICRTMSPIGFVELKERG